MRSASVTEHASADLSSFARVGQGGFSPARPGHFITGLARVARRSPPQAASFANILAESHRLQAPVSRDQSVPSNLHQFVQRPQSRAANRRNEATYEG
jgi:hypothetical protein